MKYLPLSVSVLIVGYVSAMEVHMPILSSFRVPVEDHEFSISLDIPRWGAVERQAITNLTAERCRTLAVNLTASCDAAGGEITASLDGTYCICRTRRVYETESDCRQYLPTFVEECDVGNGSISVVNGTCTCTRGP
mmetsp:Transcript_5695/g.11362  ORF Transcript_5695/g.11362 Transcript_5695/m.11362 type:complete len:136 (-) Transcript_5695:4-411(-)